MKGVALRSLFSVVLRKFRSAVYCDSSKPGINWSVDGKQTQQGTRFTVPLTLEEIAEFVGTTRETITRTLNYFKTKNFLKLQGSTMMISSRAALESIGAQ